jgi:hypothetical protein
VQAAVPATVLISFQAALAELKSSVSMPLPGVAGNVPEAQAEIFTRANFVPPASFRLMAK